MRTLRALLQICISNYATSATQLLNKSTTGLMVIAYCIGSFSASGVGGSGGMATPS